MTALRGGRSDRQEDQRATLLRTLEKVLEKRELLRENRRLRRVLERLHVRNEIIGQSGAIRHLLDMIQQLLKGDLGAAGGEDRAVLVKRYLTGQEGALPCEGMVDVLERITEHSSDQPAPPPSVRACGAVMANSRFWAKRVKSFFPGSHAPPAFHRHRYPGMTIEELRRRIQHFKKILGDETPIAAEPITPQIFRIRPDA